MMKDDTDIRALSLGARPERRAALRAAIRQRAEHEFRRRAVPPGVTGRRKAWLGMPRNSRLRSPLFLIPLATAALFLLMLVPIGDSLRDRSGGGAVREYATGAGERIELTLDDGTLVVLGPSSRLVATEWTPEKREVRLEGIAYFDVAHTPDRPFIVRTIDLTARVLGTIFVVRAYEREQQIGVAVASGRVAVSADSVSTTRAVVLNGGQVGQLRTADDLFEVNEDEQELARLLDWAKGPVRFTDRPLAEVIERLEYWYRVEFVLADSELARQSLSLRIHGEPLDDLLDAITLALNARYERSGDTVTLFPR